MTVRLEAPRRIGDAVVAAVVETRIDARAIRGTAVFTGTHAPRAILIAQGGTVSAFAPDGRPLSIETVTVLVPDAVERLLSA
jgi:hypothetical protein